MTAETYYNQNSDQLLSDLNERAEAHYQNLYNVEKNLNVIIVERSNEHYVVQFNLNDLKGLVDDSTLECKQKQNADLKQYAELYFPNLKCVELFVRESKFLLQILMDDFDSIEYQELLKTRKATYEHILNSDLKVVE